MEPINVRHVTVPVYDPDPRASILNGLAGAILRRVQGQGARRFRPFEGDPTRTYTGQHDVRVQATITGAAGRIGTSSVKVDKAGAAAVGDTPTIGTSAAAQQLARRLTRQGVVL